jgi:rhamnosyltransferase
VQFSIIVPTLNAGNEWGNWIDAVKMQSVQPQSVLVVDSSSDDDTVRKSLDADFDVRVIPRSEFNHGATRQFAVEQLSEIEICIFLTQDSILADANATKNIIAPFESPQLGMAYGRQLPKPEAGLIEAHARSFNYPPEPAIRSFDDRHRLGIKAAFTSNSFSAYRKTALAEVGGFPSKTIVSEDMYVAAKMLINGWQVAYCADALAFHSHGYTLFQELQRYFDIGVFNSREPWIRQKFGAAESEGGRFVKSELRFLINNNPLLIPEAGFRTILKLFGYRLGIYESRIPRALKRVLSMQKGYWG